VTGLQSRIAGAPISWGVCEVPGWGHQLAPARVLAEMRDLGLAATEFGPDGFLPAAPDRAAGLLAGHGLAAVGGFVPAVLHDRAHDPVPTLEQVLPFFTAAGAGSLVLAAATGRDGYDTRPRLDQAQWATLLTNLGRLRDAAAAAGIVATVHPHVGTVVQTPSELRRVLDGSDVPVCLDTGHLLVGGADPVQIAASVPDRIAHVHLKDVAADIAADVRSGRITYAEGVRSGLYRPLGQGDAGIAAIVTSLEQAGYRGWYVLEQDTALDAEPPAGGGPAADVAASLEFLARVTA
jgi:inosose dehydratase